MTTRAVVLLKVDPTPGLGEHEVGGHSQKALGGVGVHVGQSMKKAVGRKRRSDLSEKAVAMEAAFPDWTERSDGRRGRHAREFDVHAASLPRCRCGLLLPCLDCLPEHAPEFQEQRMFRSDPTMPEGSDGLNTTRIQGTPAYLREKDAQAASCYATTGRRGRPKKTSGYENMRKQNPEQFPLVDSGT